ncbi:MAG: hypothetical protein ACOX9B_15110 [Candidatus Xenobium sp.]|jgi:hypothetical protein
MLKILQKHLVVSLDEEEASKVQQSLQARYESLLHQVRLEYLQKLGLDAEAYALTLPKKDSALNLGEVFLPEPGIILYLKGLPEEGILEAGAICREANGDFAGFFEDVRNAVIEAHGPVEDWIGLETEHALVVEEARPTSISVLPNQLQAARVLLDDQSRSLLERIQEAGSIFFNKIETDNRQDTEQRIRTFEKLELVAKDFAVLCRRTGQQILRVADRATIDESSQKAFKCFICGNPISQEVVEEILTCTEVCGELLRDQKWLLVLVQGILGGIGVPTETLQVYQPPDGPVQVFLSFNGQRYLFVLATDRLTLDQAYLIGAHLAAYELDHALVISTEKVSTLMRHHLVQANPDTCFHFIDALEDLDDRLRQTLLQQQRDFLNEILGPLSQLTPVRVADLVLRRMAPEEEPLELEPEPLADKRRKGSAKKGEVPGKAPEKKTQGEAPGKAPEKTQSEAPGKAPEKTQGEAPGKAPEKTQGETPGKAPEKTQGEAPGKAPEKTQGETPGKAPEKTQGEAPGKAPEKTQGETPGKAPEKTQGEAPGKAPEKAQGKTPGPTTAR